MPFAKNDIVEVTIENISSDGNGVGRVDGQAVFIPFAAVGDVAKVRIVKVQKTFAFGRIEKILTPGAGRTQPDCPVAGVCGGCSFRHLTYEAELNAKQTIVEDAVRRLAKLDAPILPIVASPQQNRYRNKAQYPVTNTEQGGLRYGFYAGRSHRIIPCEDCLLQPEIVNQIAGKAARLLQQLGVEGYDETTHKGLLRHIYLRSGSNTGEIMLCLIVTKPQLPKEKLFVEEITAAFPSITSIVLNINREKGNVICGKHNKVLFGTETMQDTISGVPLALAPQSFSQVNTKGAEQLFAIARDYASPAATDTIVDLYCGTGVIGLSMAKGCKALIGVEIVPQAIESARQNAVAMGLANTEFLCEDAGTAASHLAQKGLQPDIVLVDPPRKGCDDITLEAITAMAPARIVMVSCNPATMARDAARLSQGGYHLEKVQPVDMFPRTRHVETCVLLSHKKSQASSPSL